MSKMQTPKVQSLCEMLAAAGGIRLVAPGKMFQGGANPEMTPEGGDLIAMGADMWHRQKPFQAKLVRMDKGISFDAACIMARENNFFSYTPDANELRHLIECELEGRPVYNADDMATLHEREMEDLAAESRIAFYGEDEPPAQPADILDVQYYETGYVNKKGVPGKTYSVKITRDGAGKPVFHHVYRSEAERDAAVQAFKAEVV